MGEDTYIIIQATVDGLSMFYRLKIVSSLTLQTFYPYMTTHKKVEKQNMFCLDQPTQQKQSHLVQTLQAKFQHQTLK